ncbi:MAG: acylglycerol kinase family protein [Acidobacteriia bacterium]|nr:acylglycerol kinase family protein [Terriglobia bacterium]
MRRALLLYNPESGRRRGRRAADVQAAAAALKAAGVEPMLEPTRAPGSAAQQTRAAIERGCDGVIVCGGDGSVHDVLPAVVGTQVRPYGIHRAAVPATGTSAPSRLIPAQRGAARAAYGFIRFKVWRV